MSLSRKNEVSEAQNGGDSRPPAVFAREDIPEISADEWMAISRALEGHHALFYAIWNMGRPTFTNMIPTAAVQFHPDSEDVTFLFNPDFWKRLDFKTKLFVIAHECLHACLNHGSRAKDAKDRMLANLAMDVVVNHTLVNSFEFNRDEIQDWKKYCWKETLFPEIPNMSERETFEYYFNQVKHKAENGGFCDGKGNCQKAGSGEEGTGQCNCPGGPQTVDDHSKMGETDGLIKKLNEELSDQEKQRLEKIVEKHGCKEQEASKDKQAGAGTGGWSFLPRKKVIKKRKWETLVRKYTKKALTYAEEEQDTFLFESRRAAISQDNGTFLPGMSMVEDRTRVKSKVDVWLFLDTSGSCYHLAERFFNAAASIPTDRFNVRLFNYDTVVYETNLTERRIYGGGGTSFSIIESFIQSDIKKSGDKYPTLVFNLTDGAGNAVNPEFAERWHWLLCEPYKEYVPKKSFIHDLSNFE